MADFERLKATYDAHFAEIDKKLSLLPQNWWDAFACHDDLAITGPKFSFVHYIGNGDGWRSVFSKYPMPSSDSGTFYFEIRVENTKGHLIIGLATKAMRLDRGVGCCGDSYGYRSDGYLRINTSWKKGKPRFSAGDVVGCGVNLANRQIIFTKNGQRLDTSDLSVSSTSDSLFPCVTLRHSDDKIVANFGPVFHFDVGTLC